MRLVLLRTLSTAAPTFAILLTTARPPAYAQDSTFDSLRPLTQDASDLAPAPSTWKGAFTDSLRLLIIEHVSRVAFQDKTRRELGGPFFSDYVRSVKIPDTWDDGDSLTVARPRGWRSRSGSWILEGVLG